MANSCYRELLRIGIPIVIAQAGTIAQSFADTAMIGLYGTPELSSAGFSNNVFNLVYFFLLGFSYATTPVIGASVGKKELEKAGSLLRDSLLSNLAVMASVMAMMLALWANISHLGQPSELIPLIRPYFLMLILSMPFLAVMNPMVQFLYAHSETKVPMLTMLAGNILNIALNYVLIFGKLSCPEMGLLGAGVATLSSRIAMAAALFIYVLSSPGFKEARRGLARGGGWKGIRSQLGLGLPIGFQLSLESASFNLTAIMMGWLGTIELAAHQIMCTVSTICYLTYYSIGSAQAVLISQSRGRGETGRIKKISRQTWILAMAIGAVLTASVLTFRTQIASCFTNDEAVSGMFFTLLVPFLIYQAGDCLQITYSNALRAIEDVRIMMVAAIVAYIIISIPLSYILAFPLGLGAQGIWLAYPAGLTSAGLMFYFRFRSQMGRRAGSEAQAQG